MRKALLVAVLTVLFSAVQSVSAQGLFAPYDGQRISARLSFLAFGAYTYRAYDTDGYEAFFGGGFHEAGLSVEYRPWTTLGFIGYGDFKGYYYEGYQDSTLGYIRVWGLPNFSLGAGVVVHFLNLTSFDVSLSYGLEFVEWFESESDTFPGFGMSARLEALWKPVAWLGVGLIGAAHYSDHAGGPKISEPGTTLLPFELYELCVGLSAMIFF
jgi:hypothetical protein